MRVRGVNWRPRILVICVGLLAGLLSARANGLSALSVLTLSLAGSVILAHPYKLLPALLGVSFLLGQQRGVSYLEQVNVYSKYYQSVVVVLGKVADDPAYDDRGQTEFHINSPSINDSKLVGRVRIRSFGASGLSRGDVVKSEGKLYPSFGNRQGSISFAETKVISKSDSLVERLRSSAISQTYSLLPEPHASLGLGFLVGVRSLLPANLETALAVTGLTHIVVASGYNLTVLVRVAGRTLGKHSHRLALIGSVLLIVGFLGVTGLSPSIVRASAVSGLALAAAYFGRSVSPYILILAPAAATAFINPLYFWSDLGWWLSFLAFSGVLILAPLVTQRIYKDREPNLLPQVLIETISAQVMALPLIMVIFGEVSVVSIIANALIVPLVPLAMLLTFVAIGSSFLLSASWLALPASLLLGLIVQIVNLLATIPGALKEVALSWNQLALIYGLIALLVIALTHWHKLYLKQKYNEETYVRSLEVGHYQKTEGR